MSGYLLAAPFVAYTAYAAARSDLRVEHVLLAAAAIALAAIGPRTRALLRGLFPIALVGLLFDAMRPYQKLGITESRVLLCDLRDAESKLFGWESGGARATVHDLLRVHHTLAVDLFFAVPYATFVLWCVAGAVFLYVRDRPATSRFAWGFFLMNLAAFVTYHALPAAPPWYFHEHGCVVDLATRASEGPALARVDAAIGVGYFRAMYSKASSVFGALPSLHCAYPFLLVLEGWRAFGPRLRVAAVGYYVWMVAAAVYLDHHWLLDAILGSAYAAGAFLVMRSVAWTARAVGPRAVEEVS